MARDVSRRPEHQLTTSSRPRRDDIEGLRALAVALVVLYHCGVRAVPGGFVGVDVFFALSGYLMTGLLLDERARSGTIDLVGFYARRIRRLLPAAGIAVAATLVAGIVILDPLALRRLVGDIVSVATYSANVRFARQGTDYLQADAVVSPLLHHWSLAVEEQFYLLWPLIMIVATRIRRVGSTLALVAVTSFLASVALTHDHPVWSYFGLHTRAWEFALGGLAVLAGRRLGDRAALWRGVLGWAGLIAIAASAARFGGDVAYPGWRAAVPVIGSLVVLDAVVSARGPGRLLSLHPLPWIGGRSYAIYLWHWPPLVLVPVVLDRALTTTEALGVALVAICVAIAVQALVEDPVRRSALLVSSRRATYAMGASVMGVLLVGSAVVWQSIDLRGRGEVAAEPQFANGALVADPVSPDDAQPVPTNLTPSLESVADDEPAIYASGCHVDIPATAPLDCRIGDGRRVVALFGDSHAAQWYPALDVVAAQHDLTIEVLTKSGCPATTIEIWSDLLRRDYTECDTWREAAFDLLAASPPEMVIVAGYPRPMLAGSHADSGPRHEDAWRLGMRTTLDRLRSLGIDTLVLGPTPQSIGRRPQCVASHLDDVRPCTAERSDVVQHPYVGIEREEAQRAGAAFVDTTDWVCDGDTCPAVVGRYLVYRDTSHLTTPFARSLAPLLEPYVLDVLDR